MKYQSSPWIPFVDCLVSILTIMIAMVYLQLLQPHLKSKEDASKAGVTPGALCVEVYWPDNIPVDIDVWGSSPDGEIIGYSNRSGKYLDLLRDDRGSDVDPAGKNYEIMCSRQLVKGRWTFDVHYYSDRTAKAKDIPVRMVLNFSGEGAVTARPPVIKTGILHQVGDEITLMDFDLDDKGKIVPGSMNEIYRPLRSYKVPH